MARQTGDDLIAFLAVTRERSFTRAAAQLGVSQPALSHTIRTLEARLGLRLLTRTTRSVSPTEAGERLFQTVGTDFDGIEAGLAALTALREKPAGSLRVTSVEHATDALLTPVLAKLLPKYPDIKVEIINDYSLIDIVAERYDAGVRLGEQVAKGMIAMRIGPDCRQAVVSTPAYLEQKGRPQTPHDLAEHTCIGLRLPTIGGPYSWPFAKGGRELKVRPEGELVFTTVTMMLNIALAGLGLANLPDDVVKAHVAEGRLVQVLADWCPPVSGYHLYYPSRRQPTPAFSHLMEALRYRDAPRRARKNVIYAPAPVLALPSGCVHAATRPQYAKTPHGLGDDPLCCREGIPAGARLHRERRGRRLRRRSCAARRATGAGHLRAQARL